MENILFSKHEQVMDELEASKKPDMAKLAELAAAAKLASDRAGKLWSRVKEFIKDRKITSADGDNVMITASYRAGSLRFDSEKLNNYFASKKIDANQFKSPVSESFIVQVISK